MASEPEFEQAYKALSTTLSNSTLFTQYPSYQTALGVVSVPERIVTFRVVWEDDKGACRVNTGYRVQFNSALGPYKGGIRFHPTVNLSILKFLGFEQVFKNALTGLNIGGAKGGADFDPKGKSPAEIRRFCAAFAAELQKHIGADTDVPAGDIGCAHAEIAHMFGAYRRARGRWDGAFSEKGLDFGGSKMRTEATGFGAVYFVGEMMRYAGAGGWEGKKLAVSGSGNVAQFAVVKAVEMGAVVVSMSDSVGSIVAKGEKGVTKEVVEKVMKLKAERKQLGELQQELKGEFEFIEGQRPWKHVGKVDVAMPCATQNEVSGEEAQALVDAGVKFVGEGSNMGCSADAVAVFEKNREKGVWYAPGKAVNAGGVAVSGLEMAQNSQRLQWTAEEVDEKLKGIMKNCFENCVTTAEKFAKQEREGLPSILAGANIAGFSKVAAAMHAQGDWW